MLIEMTPNSYTFAQADFGTIWPAGWLPQTAVGAAGLAVLVALLLCAMRLRASATERHRIGFVAYLCLFFGVAASSLTLAHVAAQTAARILQPYATGDATLAMPIASALIALLFACVLGGWATRTTLAPGWALGIAALLALHLCTSYGAPSTTLRNPAIFVASESIPLPWTLVFQLALALLLVAAAIGQDVLYRKRRTAAWPDRLDVLLESYLNWPGYTSAESILAAGVLVLGVYHVVLADTQAIMPATLNGAASAAASMVCLFMAYRRWDGNTAMLGMTLFSLAFVLFAIALAGTFAIDVPATEYARRMPSILNVLLYALWLVTALWLWLGKFWEQQLLRGHGWTTTGKMIPYANSLALYLLLVGVICAFQMTIWTLNPGIPPAHYSIAQLIIGGGGIFVLMIPALRIGIAKQNVAFASVGCALAAALFAYLAIRWPQPGVRGFLKQYAPVVTSITCVLLLLLAESLDRHKAGKVFAAPIWFLSLLFLPILALSSLVSTNRLAESWIQAGTLLPLALTYAIAGLREHRRSFVVLAAVLLAAAFGT